MTQDKAKDNAREYEILYFISIALTAEEIKNTKHKVSDIIARYGGTIIKEDEIGKRKLAYIVKHARHGHYVLTVFSAPPSQTAKINHEMDLLPEIIRHQLSLKQSYRQPKIDFQSAVLAKEKTIKKAEGIRREETRPKEKVDIQELDRKIDELLTEHNV